MARKLIYALKTYWDLMSVCAAATRHKGSLGPLLVILFVITSPPLRNLIQESFSWSAQPLVWRVTANGAILHWTMADLCFLLNRIDSKALLLAVWLRPKELLQNRKKSEQGAQTAAVTHANRIVSPIVYLNIWIANERTNVQVKRVSFRAGIKMEHITAQLHTWIGV